MFDAGAFKEQQGFEPPSEGRHYLVLDQGEYRLSKNKGTPHFHVRARVCHGPEIGRSCYFDIWLTDKSLQTLANFCHGVNFYGKFDPHSQDSLASVLLNKPFKASVKYQTEEYNGKTRERVRVYPTPFRQLKESDRQLVELIGETLTEDGAVDLAALKEQFDAAASDEVSF